MMRIRVLCGFLLCMSAFASLNPEAVKTHTLQNGMKILVLEDHSIPNANMYLFWKVGSRNEYPGITGLAHFFEHMMFNGAKKYGPKMFDQVMEAHGGANNAYTTEDLTVYTDWFPSDALEVMFDLEADRIGALAIDAAMVESERGVVASERSTGLENSPFRLLYEQVKSSAYLAHPYRWSTIGYESDIMNWTVQDLKTFFKTYYAPNNCVVVIVGDVQFEEVKTLAQKYFEPIPAQDPPRPVHTTEPPQNGERRLVYYKDISAPKILMGFHVPNSRHEDFYTLEVIDQLLGAGRGSRLYRALVDQKQLAISVNTNFSPSIDPNLFFVWVEAAPGVAEDKLEAAILEELDKLTQTPPEKDELQRIINSATVNFFRAMETINGKANNLGTYEIFFGDYRALYQAPDRYRAVTPEQVRQVAAKYFHHKNRTVGILMAEPNGDKEKGVKP